MHMYLHVYHTASTLISKLKHSLHLYYRPARPEQNYCVCRLAASLTQISFVSLAYSCLMSYLHTSNVDDLYRIVSMRLSPMTLYDLCGRSYSNSKHSPMITLSGIPGQYPYIAHEMDYIIIFMCTTVIQQKNNQSHEHCTVQATYT